MPRLKLVSIELRNWMYVAQARVEFPDHGVVWVTGVDNTSQGSSLSIGTGKTSLGLAIARTLLGIGEGNMSNYSKDQKGNLFIRLTCSIHGEPLVIDSGFKCKEFDKPGEGLRYTWRGETIERGHIRETRRSLTELVGLTPEIAQWVTMVDGDTLDFDSLSTATSIDLFNQSLELPDWNEKWEAAKTAYKSLRKERDELTGRSKSNFDQMQSTSKRIDALYEELREEEETAKFLEKNRLETLADLKQELAEEDVKLAAEEQKMKKLKKELTAVEDGYAASIRGLEKTRRAHQKRIDDRQEDLRDVKEALRTIQKDLDKVKAGSCPTCGQKIVKKHDHKIDAEQLRQDEIQRKSQLASVQEDIDDLKRTLPEIPAYPLTKSLSRSYEAAEHARDQAIRASNGIRIGISQLEVPAVSRVREIKAKIEGWATALDETKVEELAINGDIQETDASMKVAEYWVKAFSPAGIPSLALNDSVKLLNHMSAEIAGSLTGSRLGVVYGTKKTLKNGEERNSLTLGITNRHGASNYDLSSKGESGLINLFVSETLARASRASGKIGYRWYDEVFNSQDALVKTTIRRHLRETAEKEDLLIFAVDHDPEAEKFADHVLVATKNPEGVTYSWR